MLIAQEVLQTFLGNPHMLEKWTRQVTEVDKCLAMHELTSFWKFCKNVVAQGRWPTPVSCSNTNILNKENKSKPQGNTNFTFLMNKNNTHLETHFGKNSELLTVPDKFFR